MPIHRCCVPVCTYATEEVCDNVAAAMLTLHNNTHAPAAATPPPVHQHKPKAHQLDRPRIASGSTEKTWNTFHARWTIFKDGHNLTAADKNHHLFQCCD